MDWRAELAESVLFWAAVAALLGLASWGLGCAATDTTLPGGGRVRTVEMARQVEVDVSADRAWVCHHAASPGLVAGGVLLGGIAGGVAAGPAGAAAGTAAGGLVGAVAEALPALQQRDYCGRPSPARAELRAGLANVVPGASSRAAPGDRIVVEGARAIDGDTVEVRVAVPLAPVAEGAVVLTRRVRIYGIDAPELRGRCPAERAAARDAAARLAELLAGARRVELAPVGDAADRYGRLLARVAADGADIGAALIREGHARAYHGVGPRPGWCAP